MVYALDTNIIIHYLQKTPNVLRNFNTAVMQGDDLVVPKIVNYEIRRGFRIYPAPKKENVYNILTGPGSRCDVAEMDMYSWARAEQIYEELYKKRFSVGELDILIAAFCIENNHTLVTANTKHFEVIDDLHLVNWVE